MKSIMYHYVRPFNREYPYFKNLDFDNFKKQLSYFEQNYGFVSKDDFLESFEKDTIPNGVLLTFDDGLSCHYEFVYHELKRRNLWGIFYVPTFPYEMGRLLDVHRTHLLLGKYEAKEILNALNNLINNEMFDQTKIDEFRSLTYVTQTNDEATIQVKRLLNYFIDYRYRSDIVQSLMTSFFQNEAEICSSYYLKKEQIREMANNGMVIGSHTVNHPVMSRLSVEDQKYEIEHSFNLLDEITGGLDHRTFCYPYGGYHSFNETTERLLTQLSCKYSFNVEQRDIVPEDLKSRKQALPRYDCNQFKFGQI
jgi:peptidoglycan/xylan/chitin deacetylase (PgdA/CDA1 family)